MEKLTEMLYTWILSLERSKLFTNAWLTINYLLGNVVILTEMLMVLCRKRSTMYSFILRDRIFIMQKYTTITLMWFDQEIVSYEKVWFRCVIAQGGHSMKGFENVLPDSLICLRFWNKNRVQLWDFLFEIIKSKLIYWKIILRNLSCMDWHGDSKLCTKHLQQNYLYFDELFLL